MGDLSEPERVDIASIGRNIRHYRQQRGLTLSQLGAMLGCAPSNLSLIETGKREARLSLLGSIAESLDIDFGLLVTGQAPSRRDALEIALLRSQDDGSYPDLGLPYLRPSKAMSNEVLEVLVGLHERIAKHDATTPATPEEARRANVNLRAAMRARMNYYGEIEQEARALLDAVGHRDGPVGQRRIEQITDHLGFSIHAVSDLPNSTRSVTDLRNRRIYIALSSDSEMNYRTVILQALGHEVLSHTTPRDFADFLRQRIEANYFAAAMLIPEESAVSLLQRGKAGRYLAVEDLRDAYSVSYEIAGHRFTNLATRHLDLQVHFMKAHESGTVYKVYENDDLPMTTDAAGAAEGQTACRYRPARMAFEAVQDHQTYWQYFDTTAGTFWSAVQTSPSSNGRFSVSVGVKFDDAKWFRGRETALRTKSGCPDPSCCRRAPRALEEKWGSYSWPSARAHAHLLATLPPGVHPGVDETEVYSFLDRHASSRPTMETTEYGPPVV